MILKEAPKNLINLVLMWCPRILAVTSPIIAGGFIRAYFAGEHPSDLDLYFRNKEDLEKIKLDLTSNDWDITFETDRAITLKQNGKMIQLISFVYGEPSDIINSFDFTVCCAAMMLKNTKNDKDEDILSGDLFLHDDFFEHLAGRILVFNPKTISPLSSFKRVIKYVKRGYSICDENIIKISEAISKAVNFDNPDSVEQHIAGLDPNGDRRIRVID